MAVIEVVNQKKDAPRQTQKSLNRAIKYIQNEQKTTEQLSFGVNCNPDTAFAEMIAIKQLYEKEGGRQYVHFVQSFSPEDKITPEQAKEIAERLIRENPKFSGFQVVASVHTNTNQLHTHFILNTVNSETGLKWKFSANDLNNLKSQSDRLCAEYGLSVVNKVKNIEVAKEFREIANEERSSSQEEKYTKEKNISWKKELFHAVSQCLWHSTSRDDFIDKMNELGYKVNWSDTRKYITFETPDGHKCRNSKLYPPERFEKEAMLEQFSANDFRISIYKNSFISKSLQDFIRNMERSEYKVAINDEYITYTKNEKKYSNKDLYKREDEYTPKALEEKFQKNIERYQMYTDIAKCSLSVSVDKFKESLSKLGYDVFISNDSIAYRTPKGDYYSDKASYFPKFLKKESLESKFAEYAETKNMQEAIFKALYSSRTKEEYIEKLEERGYIVNWGDEQITYANSFITYTEENLYPPEIFTKENIINQLEENKTRFQLYSDINEIYYSVLSLNDFKERMESLGYRVDIHANEIVYNTPDGKLFNDSDKYFADYLKKERIEERILDNRNEFLKNESWQALRSAINFLTEENANGRPLTTIGSLEGQALKEWIKKQQFKSRYVENKQGLER